MTQKKLVILCDQFFPTPGVGAVRMTQWCRHLPGQGWQPTVLTRYYGHRATPELLSREVHPDVKVEYLGASGGDNVEGVRGGSARAGKTGKFVMAVKPFVARYVIGKLIVPDVAIKFWRGVRREVLARVKELQPDAIITASPAHSVHDLGLWLAERSGVPWVADFQDPYLIDTRYRPRGLGLTRGDAHRNFESRIYRSASKIVLAIPIHARWARMKYPFARDKIVTVTNGCPTNLADGSVVPDVTPGGRLSLRVVGFTRDREALTLARATKSLVAAGKNVELRLVGPLKYKSAPLVRELGDRVVCTGLIPHDKALSQIAGADVLICILSAERSKVMGLSSKLFEYLSTGKPVIVVNPTVPDRQLLRSVGGGVRMLSNPDVEQMAEALLWSLSPAAPPTADQTENFKSRYNRRTQMKRVAGLLSEITIHHGIVENNAG